MRIRLIEENENKDWYLSNRFYSSIKSTTYVGQPDVYEVDHVGLPLENVVLVDVEDKPKYCDAISQLMERDDLMEDELAKIVMVSPKVIEHVKKGIGWLTEGQLMMCALAFNVSYSALKEGVIRSELSEDELLTEIQRLKDEVKSLKLEMEHLEYDYPCQKRFALKYVTVSVLDGKYVFQIYDTKKETFLIESDGKTPLQYSSFGAAVEKAAYEEYLHNESAYTTKETDNEISLFYVDDYYQNLGTIQKETGDIQLSFSADFPGFDKFAIDKLNEAREMYLVKKERLSYDTEHEKTFAEQVDMVLQGMFDKYSALKVCDTPKALLQVGCQQLPVLYTQRHLRDAIHPENPKNPRWHGLTVDQVKALPTYLSEPAIIMDSLTQDNAIVVVSEYTDNKNRPLICALVPNGNGVYELQKVSSNFLTSLYGKDNILGFTHMAIENNKILSYDKNKTEKLFMFQGLQLPEAFNNLPSNEIIHPSENIFNGEQEKFVPNFGTEKEMELPYIHCVWSESRAFKENTDYSVEVFDRIMREHDLGRANERAEFLEKYGSEEEWEKQDYESYVQHLGYFKVKFEVHLKDSSVITERQDIGDGIGGVVDFFEQLSPHYQNVVEELKEAIAYKEVKNDVPKFGTKGAVNNETLTSSVQESTTLMYLPEETGPRMM